MPHKPVAISQSHPKSCIGRELQKYQKAET